MSKRTWLVYMTLAFFNDHRISSQKKQTNYSVEIKGLHSIISNKLNIDRQGGDLMEITAGQRRLRNAHITVTIPFEISWHRISQFISILTLQLMFQPCIAQSYMTQCMPELVFRKLMPAKSILKKHTMKTYMKADCEWMKYFNVMLWSVLTQIFIVLLCHKNNIIYLELSHLRNKKNCFRFPFTQILQVSILDL